MVERKGRLCFTTGRVKRRWFLSSTNRVVAYVREMIWLSLPIELLIFILMIHLAQTG